MTLLYDEVLKYEYLFRLNRTLDYIRDNFTEDLTLAKLAKVACFSKYHFHRIFRTLLGETVNRYVRRVRLERAVRMLTLDKDKSIVEIALDCGFSSSQNFAKAFKAHFGVTPTYVRTEYNWDRMKNMLAKAESEDREAVPSPGAPNTDHGFLHSGPLIKSMVEQRASLPVRVTEMPSYRVAYARTIGPYCLETAEPAFLQLLQWAMPRGLINEKTLILGVLRNDPNVTPVDKCIYDACITIPESVRSDGRINVQSLPGGKFAVYHCEIDPEGHHEAWMRLIIHWLLSSGYQPDSRPYYEIIYNITEEYPLRRHVVDLCLPIRPS
ncbi:MAG TPA: AraC family transcriptional regulator [Deltaproteobacteria bacterium]|jgi:AraC family transcriptional regulator|nr:AraC family transcriptional regulator [Deltaproteobacteria bacterium]HIJ75833.1 AraC family transcriptional regulator [Deltaproteobacteria bacterium]